MSGEVTWELTAEAALKERRNAFIKEHAPKLLAARISGGKGSSIMDAISYAGELFDKLEELKC